MPGRFAEHFESLRRRQVTSGGFASRPGEETVRPDTTAWAVLALLAAGSQADAPLIAQARESLSALQFEDGRLGMGERGEAFWPTALAVLAWQGSPPHRQSLEAAIAFLLRTTGNHFEKTPDMPIGHDPSIRGWPWVEKTHSWVEPTALGLLAASVAGEGSHPRALEAVRLLMNRQLPDGGWNYGNTFVYGKQLLPLPQTTGVALSALEGHVSEREIKASLDYLEKAAESLTPLSLAWAILGLSGWKRRPGPAEQWIEARLSRQDRYGDYTTDLLSVLLIAALAPRGLAVLVAPRKSR